MYQQTTLWEFMFNKAHIDKPIRLIELFAGIGSQHKALSVLCDYYKVPFESYKICEWAYNSIVGYNYIHIKDFKNYANDKTKEELIKRINGISLDYNTPYNKLDKKPIEWLQSAYNHCEATHNLINIMNVKGEDLEIKDKHRFTYLLTYSFPCQDLSNAGLRKGMSVSQSEGGTRSGLLWEVERILKELKPRNELPQILLMENVPEVIGKNNINDFQKWVKTLEDLGYQNYTNILKGNEFGIAQSRKRCFMISVLGEVCFSWNKGWKNTRNLSDFLEDYVELKYYLPCETIKKLQKWNTFQKPLGHIEKDRECCQTLTARGSHDLNASMVLVRQEVCKTYEGTYQFSKSEKFMHSKSRFNKGKQTSDTIQTSPKEAIVESVYTGLEQSLFTPDMNIRHYLWEETIEEFKEGQMATTSYPNGRGHGSRVHDEAIALTCHEIPSVKKNYLIRKITPKESLRLMGFTDKDYYALKDAGLSDRAIYHCAGDSIIVPCLIAILQPLFNESWGNWEHKKVIENYIETIIDKREE